MPGDVSGESVDGLLVEEEVTTEAHDNIAMYLGAWLLGWLRPRVFVFLLERKYAVSRVRGRSRTCRHSSPVGGGSLAKLA